MPRISPVPSPGLLIAARGLFALLTETDRATPTMAFGTPSPLFSLAVRLSLAGAGGDCSC
jgi:hypothetical protein